ncbi:MAG: metallophosphoesterase family protein [Candidatus Woesearchaeota archaeon]
MKTFFTADTHFSHRNIIRYCNRPFKDEKEMDETLITNWNSVVRSEDVVYHLGDVGFTNEDKLYQILKRLNGKIHLIYGNHDKIIRKSNLLQSRFESTNELKKVYIQDMNHPKGRHEITLCHYAMRVWDKSHHGSFHLFGHSHGSLSDDPNSLSLDVGVDNWNFKPVSFNEIIEKMKQKTFISINYHE